MSAKLTKEQLSDNELEAFLTDKGEGPHYEETVACHQCGVPVRLPETVLKTLEAAWDFFDRNPDNEKSVLENLENALQEMGRKRQWGDAPPP